MDIIKKFFEYSKNLWNVCFNNLIIQKIIKLLVLCYLLVIFLFFLVFLLVFIIFIFYIIYYIFNLLFGNYYYFIEYNYIYYKISLLKILVVLIFFMKLILDLGFYLANLSFFKSQNFINFKKEKNIVLTYDIEIFLLIIILSILFYSNQFILSIFIVLLIILYKHYSKSINRIIDDYVYDNKIKIILKCVVRIIFLLIIIILLNQFII